MESPSVEVCKPGVDRASSNVNAERSFGQGVERGASQRPFPPNCLCDWVY